MSKPELDMIQTLLDAGDLTAPQSGVLKFSAGSTIFLQGDTADCAYMIDNGYVEICRNVGGGKNTLAVLGSGEIFGEMALIDGLARGATATAIHETTVVLITRKQLLDAIDGAGPIARLILVASIKRLREGMFAGHSSADRQGWGASDEIALNPYYDSTRLDAASQLRRRLELEAAIRKEELQLAYQPIVSLADGRTEGFEALIRWRRSDGQAVSPVDFIPLAEESGLIIPLGVWVLEQALCALKSIDRIVGKRRAVKSKIFMSVNVSPRQLDSEENVETLARLIEQSDVDASHVKLEITEQALLVDPKRAMLSLARLKASGASIAIDDFGTGYSSLSYLHQYPLDTMKIDRSFVKELSDNLGSQRVVAAIIALAHELGMNVVAEGIEKTGEVKWLQAQNCRYGQGYLMAKPVSFASALDYLDRHFEW